MISEEWFIYVLECADGTLYTGITKNVTARLESHNSQKGAKYTRSRVPCKVIASCSVGSKSEALKAEIRFKRLSRQQKLEKISDGIRVFVDSLFPKKLN